MIFPTGGNNQARTVVNAGTVEVDGSLGAVRLAGGTIGGTGTVGAITSNTGAPARAAPSARAITFPATQIGTLTATGALAQQLERRLRQPGEPG